MKAVICERYGLPDTFTMKEVAKPVPRDNEVLVEMHASSVTTHNLCAVSGRPLFVRLMGSALLKPKIKTPGSDIAGTVIEAGKRVTRFKSGDEVFGDTSEYGFGAYSEYVCVPEEALELKPSNLSFAEAASVPQAALVALQGLRDKGQIRNGQRVLIYGASGGIGTFAVQIAKCLGAEVTGVCSTGNLDLVRSLGADHVIDYTKTDFTKSGQRYDLIFAIASRDIADHLRALTPGGTYVSTGSPSLTRVFQDMLIGPRIAKKENKRVVGGWSITPNKDLAMMKELIETGRVRPVIDRCYPLNQAAEAFRYFAQGHSRGRVVITIVRGSEQ